MGLFFVGTRDLARLDMSGLGPRDTVVVIGRDNSTWNEENCAKLRFVEGSQNLDPDRDNTGIQSRLFQSGKTLICCTSHPLLTWPRAKDGVIQVFWHEDWPGSYQAVNINSLLWVSPIVPVEDIIHRSIQLPELPVPLRDLPSAGTRSYCLQCHTNLDLRFGFGHAWYDGISVVRAGTTEVIGHMTRVNMIDMPGPYCAQCIGAAVMLGDLTPPAGSSYNDRHNRSFPVDQNVPDHPSNWMWGEHPYAQACQVYGRQSYEWMLAEDRALTRRRVQSAAKLLAGLVKMG